MDLITSFLLNWLIINEASNRNGVILPRVKSQEEGELGKVTHCVRTYLYFTGFLSSLLGDLLSYLSGQLLCMNICIIYITIHLFNLINV